MLGNRRGQRPQCCPRVVLLARRARSGTLRTAVWWAKCGRQGEVWCAACGVEEETLEPVVLDCKAIQPHQPSGTTLEQALCFEPSQPPGGGPIPSEESEGKGGAAAVESETPVVATEQTKRHLDNWFGRRRSGVVG
ncbi:hypothetical protein HPB48_023421 [Haemaphysalis longicornis]|uniref:Uncharacterized protein n=1 Tax=Haemaphysalis longicornis TaxID=44386 RepID=A0A9J6H5B2_HAELO|nr:hypothetical protein HPB48_023421 [Haemaphysalis longicornis]